jgi:diaminopimelate decarboxylase
LVAALNPATLSPHKAKPKTAFPRNIPRQARMGNGKMSNFYYHQNELYAEKIDVKAVAQKFGTPTFVYSKKQICQNYQALYDCLKNKLSQDRFMIAYATKANGGLSILKTLAGLGAGADIVSYGEMRRALHAGIDAQKIIFSGVGKTDFEITAALKAGIYQINVESLPELLRISELAQELGLRAAASIRVNPDVDAGTHEKITTGKKENKFGIDIDACLEIFEIAKNLPHIDICGVAIHIGSQLLELAPYEAAFKRVLELYEQLYAKGIKLSRIDLGGGMGITYHSEDLPLDLEGYAALVARYFSDVDCKLIFEPGRSIIGNAGILLSQALYIKKTAHKNYLILDAGMNDLIRPALYDAYHAIIPITEKPKLVTECYDVVGPICESSDVFLKDEIMPSIDAKDYVAIMNAGAYCAVMASHYNTRALATEIMVDGDQIHVMRARETVDDLLKREIMF